MGKSFVFKTEDGTEVISFYQWVLTNGSAEEKAIHDNGPSPELSALLTKYWSELKVKTVSTYEDDQLIDGPTLVE
jgi:hypothetical protein